MTDNKLDRANLRRQVQRTEPYTSLLSKRRSRFKTNDNAPHKQNTEREAISWEVSNNDKENMVDGKNPENIVICASPPSTVSSSSDSSQDYHPNFLYNRKAIQCNLQQSELEVTPVMTRSATRKYASVGAIHNYVDFEKELKVRRNWPDNISYSIPGPPQDHLALRDTITKSLNKVMSFCKDVAIAKNLEPEQTGEEVDTWEFGDGPVNFIDLSPYLTQEPVIINGNHETQITFHLNDQFIPHQFINIVSVNEEEQDGHLVIQGENDDFETITLHSGDTYFLHNKYFNSTTSSYFHPDACSFPQNIFTDDPMLAVHNDHTYATKYPEKISIVDKEPKPSNKSENHEFKIQNAMRDLLLNTVILKSLICGDSPQDMMAFLEKAKTYY